MSNLIAVSRDDGSEVLFSSWEGKIFDNRSRNPHVEQPHLPDHFGKDARLKAMIGWEGLVIRDANVNVVALCHNYMAALAKQSCGKCSPCPGGTKAMTDLLAKICRGKGEVEYLEQLKIIAQTVMETSRCGIGLDGPRALLHALEHFRDQFLIAVKDGVREQATFKSKATAPCMEACPIHLDIPLYVDLIREGSFEKSLDSIRTRLPLPGVLGRTCFRPCESNCRRANIDEPIAIKALKRFVADEVRKRGDASISSCLVSGCGSAATRQGRVAIIGAGPAGLSCAYHLAQLGHVVNIYEMLNEPGGMAAVGIPDYRLPRDVLREEAERIQSLGVTIHYGVRIGRDKLLTELLSENDAVFVSVGAQNSSPARIEGEDQHYQGYIPGIQYLRGINENLDPYPQGRRVAVIGGGNVAIDCVRTALRMHKDDVSLLYRRTRAEMPADELEIHEAEEENVNFHFLVAPVRIVADNGRVVGLECQRMELGPADASGRRSPIVVPGSEFIFECDTIVSAIGQRVDLSFLAGTDEVATTVWHTLKVDPITRQSSMAKIFSAGDCETGPDALVTAAAGGLRAAQSIHEFIGGSQPSYDDDDHFESFMKNLKLYDQSEQLDRVAQIKREHPTVLPVEVRTKSYDEVEQVFTRAEAMAEASRCLHCYRVVTIAL